MASSTSRHSSRSCWSRRQKRTDRANAGLSHSWPGGGPHELGDVGLGNSVRRCAHRGEREVPKELTLPTREQHLGDAWCGKDTDMPGAPVCDVSQSLQAESGEPHFDGRKAENV